MDGVIREALEAARHELTTLHNLTVTDRPDANAEAENLWVTDTSSAVALIDRALADASEVGSA